ncbi:biotin/lipoyl-containing protein [Actomonas aquatica]|uniref:Biotin/lipoyl-containing protein n=1 Tax=Actomonas aquatica TaxID=2866162 RepID=A0ABZ1CBX2_9BACT|nr:acetyl-CoA carboxylase biotin carboxyl carrier protein subunit [Opitutus sp. WL0086]WRQ88074.1 biotin/lipoyl-containing protein [Opitutus sp. WL0086]
MKKLRVTVDGKSYDVVVETLDETPAVASAAAPLPAATPPVAAPAPAAPRPAPAPVAAGAGAIVSPLAGKIVSVDVKVGDTIEAGAQVATVEAMKMNTFIYAEQAGTVSSVAVAPGDGVEEGAVILQLG